MIEIHTLRWQADHAAKAEDGEEGNVSIYCRVFVEGREIENVLRARSYHGTDFSHTVIAICQPVEVVNHTKESWDALDDAVVNPHLRMAQALRLLRDTTQEGGYVQNVAIRALLEAGVPDPPEEDHL